jgi:hypothetical protein
VPAPSRLVRRIGLPANPACIKAEVDQLTGHVLCIEPLGAAVEPPPPHEAFLQAAGRGEGPVELQPELQARSRGDVTLAGRVHRASSIGSQN